MIRNVDLIEHIKEMLANDKPTTEIAEALDILSAQSENFDAGIFFNLNEDFELNVKVAGDTGTQCYALAVELLDVINADLEGRVLKATLADAKEVQLALDTDIDETKSILSLSSDVENVSTAQE